MNDGMLGHRGFTPPEPTKPVLDCLLGHNRLGLGVSTLYLPHIRAFVRQGRYTVEALRSRRGAPDIRLCGGIDLRDQAKAAAS